MYEEHRSFKLPKNSEEKMIWRYMDLPKFIDLIDRRALFFTKASRYPDPYEGTIPKHNELVRKTIYEKGLNLKAMNNSITLSIMHRKYSDRY